MARDFKGNNQDHPVEFVVLRLHYRYQLPKFVLAVGGMIDIFEGEKNPHEIFKNKIPLKIQTDIDITF